MKKNILIILVMFIMLPLTVYADCTSDFEKVKNDFKVSYKYNADTDDFNIIFVNPDYDKYTFGFHDKDEINHVEIKYEDKQATITVKNYKGDKYDYAFLATYSECRNKIANKGTIELKKYNPYSDDPLCLGNEEFALCQKDDDKAVDEETFKSRLETYKASKEKKEDDSQQNTTPSKEDSKEKKITFIDTITNYVQEHMVEVVIIVVIIVTFTIGTIVYIIKSRRLE